MCVSALSPIPCLVVDLGQSHPSERFGKSKLYTTCIHEVMMDDPSMSLIMNFGAKASIMYSTK